MKTVAIAGGQSNVGWEVIERILTKGTHEVRVLTRNDSNRKRRETALVTWVAVDYDDEEAIALALKGVDTVLSFITNIDPGAWARSHINLINACLTSGVKRFAPSEWACREDGAPAHYDSKTPVRRYLEEINHPVKKLEYCLFQPGFFANYFAPPGRVSTKHFHMQDMCIDFENRRAWQIADGKYSVTLTTVEDLAEVVARALDFVGPWPEVGGVRGSQVTVASLLSLGEDLRGKFQIDRLSYDAAKKGTAETTWYPLLEHPSIPSDIPADTLIALSKKVHMAYAVSFAEGAWSVSDEWNQLLPEYHFTSAEQYLRRAWSEA
ncbi:hypothetical protein LMH87_002634 [Akanthomyces muscarius]|uniref:NmrA-like domain-containing protein n=1 Tax=Akanthomyces muscarius TaxID=2231603 RepID=A0A9W8Q7G9_AKAMU|nr:hypothetical protein LMH87_002634 [Akanthomyces muscarius]KAJ4148152.1 hypothetical protein LMH87_002634 [Akanthomyces muscarius]